MARAPGAVTAQRTASRLSRAGLARRRDVVIRPMIALLIAALCPALAKGIAALQSIAKNWIRRCKKQSVCVCSPIEEP
ncbi:MAG: hypothetical protein ABT10_12805 [Novosphingobium sp. SCN 63-17]|nr:MAG: hypothetical protein ABT10_12805 [Novosphingobium sp. SCN 63-17]OJX95108.1 MAG: hypothetical protein BGP00_09575 [Novosphingobium sp. 63-713]